RDGIEAEAQAVHHARAKVVHHDVRAFDQRLDPLEIPGSLQVRREALLVAVDGVKERAVRAERLVRELQLAGEITALRALHLDDLGAEVGQPQAAGRSRQELTEIEDPHPCERTLPVAGWLFPLPRWLLACVRYRQPCSSRIVYI